MLKTILFLLAAATVGAQELTFTLKAADGEVYTRTMSGEAVSAGLEIIEQWRQRQCVGPERQPPAQEYTNAPCKVYRYNSTLEAVAGYLVESVAGMADQFPTSATARERAAAAAAEAAVRQKLERLVKSALQPKD